jgi:hypothetical protein
MVVRQPHSEEKQSPMLKPPASISITAKRTLTTAGIAAAGKTAGANQREYALSFSLIRAHYNLQ